MTVGVARNPSSGNCFLGYEVILIMIDVSICHEMGGTLWLQAASVLLYFIILSLFCCRFYRIIFDLLEKQSRTKLFSGGFSEPLKLKLFFVFSSSFVLCFIFGFYSPTVGVVEHIRAKSKEGVQSHKSIEPFSQLVTVGNGYVTQSLLRIISCRHFRPK